MLDSQTKRRIDTARDILVGKVPDPKSQVEQITIALIYKFMDDMDAQAEELGGKRKFFTGDFARFGWAKLMRSGLGGHETLNLYADSIARMPQNPGIPPLFRDIFKNAYLPYRDPETLRAFLKIIDEFEYDHSERLGDAFEYLLSVLGSQGDAGQFRTPRHIIDFIVQIIDPKKDETVLDPACGTAGFLISAYKHILRNNSSPSPEQPNGKDDGEASLHTSHIPMARGDQLTPDDRNRLAANFRGYDISPDMVRLSLVNMYLHGFTAPHIYEYDTLTSQERWDKDYADVILANPPFMSPKGGIKPHNRFSVPSKRSEVLFVDYMAEHLTPAGRAGIIVPEGIIFQSQTAHKTLRKMLVEQSLIAVVSLPAGVFNPYSGVKTSILILDKSLAKQSQTIGFFKVENDGFHLGAQRRPIDKNDLAEVLAEVSEYLRRLRARESVTPEDFTPTHGLIVTKEKIAADRDYNLNGERHRDGAAHPSTFPLVPLGEICELARGVVYNKGDEVEQGGFPVLRANNINLETSSLDLSDVKRIMPKLDFSDDKKLRRDDIFICLASGSKNHIGKVAHIHADTDFYFGGFMGAVRADRDRVLSAYLFHQLRNNHFNDFLREQIAGANINNLSGSLLYRFEIPLPPLEVQKEIVAEIEGYQKVIDGARAVLDHYRPHIPIQPDWPMVTVGDACTISSGGTPSKANEAYWNGDVPWVSAKDLKSETIEDAELHISEAAVEESSTKIAEPGSVLVLVRGMGLANGVPVVEIRKRVAFNQDIRALTPKEGLLPTFLRYSVAGAVEQFARVINSAAHGTLKIDTNDLLNIQIPLPPLETQRGIVAEIEAERRLVEGNRELIARMEKKITATLARIWGEQPEPALDTLASTVAARSVARNLFGEADQSEQYLRNGCLVACRAITKVRKIGKTWLEKALHLVETHCVLPMGRQPLRMEHGPADLAQHDRIMAWAKQNDVFTVQETGPRQRATYTPKKNFDATLADAGGELGDKAAAIDRLLTKLSPLRTEQMEWLATAYASWNDFLIDKLTPSDDDIIKDIRTNWHASKQKVKDADWRWALKWLRDNKLVPTGHGRRVEPAV